VRNAAKICVIILLVIHRLDAGEHGSSAIVKHSDALGIPTTAADPFNQISFLHDITPPDYLSHYLSSSHKLSKLQAQAHRSFE
jgi:hypothetical protein